MPLFKIFCERPLRLRLLTLLPGYNETEHNFARLMDQAIDRNGGTPPMWVQDLRSALSHNDSDKCSSVGAQVDEQAMQQVKIIPLLAEWKRRLEAVYVAMMDG